MNDENGSGPRHLGTRHIEQDADLAERGDGLFSANLQADDMQARVMRAESLRPEAVLLDTPTADAAPSAEDPDPIDPALQQQVDENLRMLFRSKLDNALPDALQALVDQLLHEGKAK